MKKEELRAALGKIQPDKELVEQTIEKALRREDTSRSPSFAFSYRTAAALCSIVLVLALGFIVARIALPSPAVDT
ncbi:MAG: hypothetical protein IJP17_06835, partial [Clostridia bacterium]|nr:hypothetical protein [Clostridia bacterium]